MFFEYRNKTFVTGLFKAHDTYGIPLEFSLMVCMEKGFVPCLEQFALDAVQAGWGRDKAEKLIAAAKADVGYIDASTRPTTAKPFGPFASAFRDGIGPTAEQANAYICGKEPNDPRP